MNQRKNYYNLINKGEHMTTIYLIRHSKPMNTNIKQISNSESLQIINEKKKK